MSKLFNALSHSSAMNFQMHADILSALNKELLNSSLQFLFLIVVLLVVIIFLLIGNKRCVKCGKRVLLKKYFFEDEKIVCEKCSIKDKYEVVFSINEREKTYSLDSLASEKEIEKSKARYNYGRFIVKNSKVIFAIFIAFFLIFASYLAFIPNENYDAIYEKEKTESEKANTILKNEFPHFYYGNKVVVVLRSEDIKGNATKIEVINFESAVRKKTSVYSIYSIYEDSISETLEKLNRYLLIKNSENNFSTINDFKGDLLRNNSFVFFPISLFLGSWNSLNLNLDERNNVSYAFAKLQFKNVSFFNEEEKNISLSYFNLFYEKWQESFYNENLTKITSEERANYCINATIKYILPYLTIITFGNYSYFGIKNLSNTIGNISYLNENNATNNTTNQTNFYFGIENWDNESTIHDFAILYYENKTLFNKEFIEKAYSFGAISEENLKNLTRNASREIVLSNSFEDYPIRLKDIEKNFIDNDTMVILIEFNEKDSNAIKENIKFVKESTKIFSSEFYLTNEYYSVSEKIINAEDNFHIILAIILSAIFIISIFVFRSIIIPIILIAVSLISIAIYEFLFSVIAVTHTSNHFAIIGLCLLFSVFYLFSSAFILKFKEETINGRMVEDAINNSLKQCRKFYFLSLILFLIFLQFYFSSFKEVKLIAVLFFSAVITAFLTSFLLLPSLIVLLKGKVFYPFSPRLERKYLLNLKLKKKKLISSIVILLLIASFGFYAILIHDFENEDNKIFVVVDGQNLYEDSALYKKIETFTKNIKKINQVEQILSPIFQDGNFFMQENATLKEKIQTNAEIGFYSKEKTFVIEIYIEEMSNEEKISVVEKVRSEAKAMKLNAKIYTTGKIAEQKDNENIMTRNLFFSFVLVLFFTFAFSLFYFESIISALKLVFLSTTFSLIAIAVVLFLIPVGLIEFQILVIITFAIIFTFNFAFERSYASFLIFAAVFLSMLLYDKNLSIAFFIALLFSFLSSKIIFPTLRGKKHV